jgi:hypothetical protein
MPNVIIFGATGAGKSSLVNMLEGKGEERAEVDGGAKGVTFTNTCYTKMISNLPCQLFDTVGLNEGSGGLVDVQAAIGGLYKLIRKLDNGVNLLVYVMRAPRITEAARQNYELFHNVFCQKKVPIVIVITGLENEDNMDEWWEKNEHVFDDYKMKFNGHACITACKGKVVRGIPRYKEEYEESKKKVERLIYDACRAEPWRMKDRSWFVTTVATMYNRFVTMLGMDPVFSSHQLCHALERFAGLDKHHAVEMAVQIERDLQLEGKGRKEKIHTTRSGEK